MNVVTPRGPLDFRVQQILPNRLPIVSRHLTDFQYAQPPELVDFFHVFPPEQVKALL